MFDLYAQAKGIIVIGLSVVTLLFGTLPIYAHPGSVATDGCHYCRTNCDRWGKVQDTRHCHIDKQLVCSQPNTSHELWLRNLLKTKNGIRYLLSIIATVALERELGQVSR